MVAEVKTGIMKKAINGLFAKRDITGMVALVCSGTLVTLFGALLWFVYGSSLETSLTALGNDIQVVENNVRLRLDGNRDYLQLLAGDFATGAVNEELFQERVSLYVADHPELINVTWAGPNDVIRSVAPIEGNRQIVGLTLSLPEPKRAATKAQATGRPVYTRPFEAIQGNASFEVWVPIFRDQEFLGLLAGVYSCNRLLERVVPETVLQRNHLMLVGPTGAVIGGVPARETVDGRFATSVQLSPPGNGVGLVTERYGSGTGNRGLVLLGIVAMALSVGTGFWMWLLSRELHRRRRAEEEIHQLNDELEQRVRDRTAALEAANQELEAFSYSVSHDLRAPLRHLTGYSELLKKNDQANFDETARRHLTFISESAVRMGRLIDGLLAFSRAGRTELRKEPVKLNELVKEVVEGLTPDTQDRRLLWKIAPLPDVNADPVLLRAVLTNLFSNALKFTRPRDEAVIEIGVMEGGNNGALETAKNSASPQHSTTPPLHDSITFFIRDNGVGFDMKYVGKLFRVFQRLHTLEEFEGTGIGLANVRRIIQRHGGRTWAKSVLDEGATFYFSLPKKVEKGGGGMMEQWNMGGTPPSGKKDLEIARGRRGECRLYKTSRPNTPTFQHSSLLNMERNRDEKNQTDSPS